MKDSRFDVFVIGSGIAGQNPRKLQFDGHVFLRTSDDFLKLKNTIFTYPSWANNIKYML